MVVATAIVVDTTMTMDNVVVLIIAKGNLAFGALAVPTVGGLAELSAELLRSFAKETLADMVRLLAFDRTNSLPGINA